MPDAKIFPTTIEKILFIKKVDIFSEAIPESLLHVASIANEISVAKGEIIFTEGDPSVYLYLVALGKIRISREEREIFHAVQNESFGLVGLVEERQRATHAMALSDSTLLRVGHSDLFDLMEDYPAITRGVLRGISKVLRKLL
ncbi:MAG: cyclic nucleotide-binding domain-containing protein [Candidatus Marinimicrobia bacterium]|nr:cyclic nucleotide-binding domain-containing protein [Candidatus Neomarinimicrobiota bacterium]